MPAPLARGTTLTLPTPGTCCAARRYVSAFVPFGRMLQLCSRRARSASSLSASAPPENAAPFVTPSMPAGGVTSVSTAPAAALNALPPATACAGTVTESAPAASTAASVVSNSAAPADAAHTVPCGISTS